MVISALDCEPTVVSEGEVRGREQEGRQPPAAPLGDTPGLLAVGYG